jgi:hypothetical protein
MDNAPKITPEWMDSHEAPMSLYLLFGKILATVAMTDPESGTRAWMAEIHSTGAKITLADRGDAKLWVERSIERLRHETEDFILIEGICPVRSTPWSIRVRRDGYDAWKTGTPIENAFPELTGAQRETLMSGMSPDGFAMMFGKEEGQVGE